MGIAPVITDGYLVLGESGAIMDYIIAKTRPIRRWCRAWITPILPTTCRPPLGERDLHGTNGGTTALVAQFMGAEELPAFVADRVAKGWAIVEARLGEAEYFGGEQLTTADIMMGFQLTTSRAMSGSSIDGMPNWSVPEAHRRAPRVSTRDGEVRTGMPPKLD